MANVGRTRPQANVGRTRPNEVNNHLPPELLGEILARLPAKKVLEFRSVCKNWWSFIDSSDFISWHMNHYLVKSSARTQLLTFEHESVNRKWVSQAFALREIDSFRRTDFVWKNQSKELKCRTSMVNGLIVVSNSECFMLCNPSVRKFLTLPPCPLKKNRLCTPFLGYVANDFRVVVFEVMTGDAAGPCHVFIAVYSLLDHSWRETFIPATRKCTDMLKADYPETLYFQGGVYWIPVSIAGQDVDPELMCFDFEAEEFRGLKVPNTEEDMLRLPFIFGGSLAVFGMSSVRNCIWVFNMNPGNDSWHLCWSNSENVEKVFSRPSYLEYRLRMWHIEETGTLLFHDSGNNKLLAYNIGSSDIPIQYLAQKVPFRYVDIFTESLVLHNRDDDAAVQNH